MGVINAPRLIRRRLIPDEAVELKNDEILRADDEIIITKWRALKPRGDFNHGCSCYFINEGYKVSKMFSADNEFLYYYCDIVKSEYSCEDNSYVFVDLLFDVVVTTNGTVKVMDLGEGAEALKSGAISSSDLCLALETLDKLLHAIYGGGFGELTRYIDNLEIGAEPQRF